jgi:hypothetical protein
MSEFYSPKADQSGAALFVTFNSKEGSVYCKFLQQTSWNAQTKKGGFQGGQIINFKLSQDETGAIIESVRNKNQTSFYHQFDGGATTGSFSYYRIEPKTSKDKVREGFGFKVKKGDLELKVGFTLGSAERLMEFLKFSLDHVFSAEYSVEKKKNEEYLKKKEQETKAKPAKKPESEPEPETSEEPNDNPFEENSQEEVEF